jgi:hypothetical protein
MYKHSKSTMSGLPASRRNDKKKTRSHSTGIVSELRSLKDLILRDIEDRHASPPPRRAVEVNNNSTTERTERTIIENNRGRTPVKVLVEPNGSSSSSHAAAADLEAAYRRALDDLARAMAERNDYYNRWSASNAELVALRAVQGSLAASSQHAMYHHQVQQVPVPMSHGPSEEDMRRASREIAELTASLARVTMSRDDLELQNQAKARTIASLQAELDRAAAAANRSAAPAPQAPAVVTGAELVLTTELLSLRSDSGALARAREEIEALTRRLREAESLADRRQREIDDLRARLAAQPPPAPAPAPAPAAPPQTTILVQEKAPSGHHHHKDRSKELDAANARIRELEGKLAKSDKALRRLTRKYDHVKRQAKDFLAQLALLRSQPAANAAAPSGGAGPSSQVITIPGQGITAADMELHRRLVLIEAENEKLRGERSVAEERLSLALREADKARAEADALRMQLSKLNADIEAWKAAYYAERDIVEVYI